MQLTLHSDYSLRILLYLTENPGRYVSTREISTAYGISRTHLVRVVQTLLANGFVEVTEGRNGGVRLAADPAKINVGQVVRKTEANFKIVECFDLESNTCPIVPVCRLRGVLQRALEAFLTVLDGYTLAELIPHSRGRTLAQYLNITTS